MPIRSAPIPIPTPAPGLFGLPPPPPGGGLKCSADVAQQCRDAMLGCPSLRWAPLPGPASSPPLRVRSPSTPRPLALRSASRVGSRQPLRGIRSPPRFATLQAAPASLQAAGATLRLVCVSVRVSRPPPLRPRSLSAISLRSMAPRQRARGRVPARPAAPL